MNDAKDPVCPWAFTPQADVEELVYSAVAFHLVPGSAVMVIVVLPGFGRSPSLMCTGVVLPEQ